MNLIDEEIVLEKDKKRALRRKNNVYKAIRKRNISKHVYNNIDWYSNLHQYSKNKVHCSCQLCRYRSIFSPDTKPIGETKKLIGMKQDLKFFKDGKLEMLEEK